MKPDQDETIKRMLSQRSPVSLAIPVRFAPSVFFIVVVLAGSTSGRPARRLGKDNFPCSIVGQGSRRWSKLHQLRAISAGQ